MKLYSKLAVALMAVFLIISIMTMPAFAEWSGALIVTGEYPIEHKPLTIYTAVLDYEITDWWFADLVIDTHPLQGVDVDVSTTMYFPPLLSKTIYVTAGVRSGVWRSDRPPSLYTSSCVEVLVNIPQDASALRSGGFILFRRVLHHFVEIMIKPLILCKEDYTCQLLKLKKSLNSKTGIICHRGYTYVAWALLKLDLPITLKGGELFG